VIYDYDWSMFGNTSHCLYNFVFAQMLGVNIGIPGKSLFVVITDPNLYYGGTSHCLSLSSSSTGTVQLRWVVRNEKQIWRHGHHRRRSDRVLYESNQNHDEMACPVSSRVHSRTYCTKWRHGSCKLCWEDVNWLRGRRCLECYLCMG
jgi:hypothetical protein